MKACKKCGADFEPSKGLVSYCSLKCRNSRERSDEVKKKISNSMLISESAKTAVLNKNWAAISKKQQETIKRRLLAEDFDKLKFERIKLRVLYEQDEKCNNCGISEWQGQKITLELEHKDGNHFNNDRQNLEVLCPNCHALTETWRGRNKRVKSARVSDETLYNALIENDWNMRQSLIQVGLAPKGGNYKRCHKLKNDYDTY
jgi:RNA polymerase subunit RPABC4/transcription elongation factor Spt4